MAKIVYYILWQVSSWACCLGANLFQLLGKNLFLSNKVKKLLLLSPSLALPVTRISLSLFVTSDLSDSVIVHYQYSCHSVTVSYKEPLSLSHW